MVKLIEFVKENAREDMENYLEKVKSASRMDHLIGYVNDRILLLLRLHNYKVKRENMYFDDFHVTFPDLDSDYMFHRSLFGKKSLEEGEFGVAECNQFIDPKSIYG
jgi:hypothetical protein